MKAWEMEIDTKIYLVPVGPRKTPVRATRVERYGARVTVSLFPEVGHLSAEYVLDADEEVEVAPEGDERPAEDPAHAKATLALWRALAHLHQKLAHDSVLLIEVQAALNALYILEGGPPSEKASKVSDGAEVAEPGSEEELHRRILTTYGEDCDSAESEVVVSPPGWLAENAAEYLVTVADAAGGDDEEKEE